MHDFSCTKPQDMYYKILADRVRYFKEDKKGILTMCREMENMRRETAHEKSVEIAKKMLLSLLKSFCLTIKCFLSSIHVIIK